MKLVFSNNTNQDRFAFVVCSQKSESQLDEIPIMDFVKNVKLPVSVDVFVEFENQLGLSRKYNGFLNEHIMEHTWAAFVHDDWMCNDVEFFDKVRRSEFDLIGTVGGLQYCVPSDWETRPFLWTEACQGKASGFVQHVHPQYPNLYLPSSFGVAPLPCVWLDGQCLIFTRKAIESALTFDEDFAFDHYDGAVCFRAREKGLKVGTAPILATHASAGQGMMAHKDAYMESQKLFIKKWFKSYNISEENK